MLSYMGFLTVKSSTRADEFRYLNYPSIKTTGIVFLLGLHFQHNLAQDLPTMNFPSDASIISSKEAYFYGMKGANDDLSESSKVPTLIHQQSGNTELDDAVIRPEPEAKMLSLMLPRKLFVETSWCEEYCAQIQSLESHSPIVFTHTLFTQNHPVSRRYKPLSLIDIINSAPDSNCEPKEGGYHQSATVQSPKKLPIHRRSVVGLMKDFWINIKKLAAPSHNNKVLPCSSCEE